MKPVARVAVAAVMLGLAAACAHAQQAAPAPDAGWGERDYLLHYATVVCVRGAYSTLAPPASPVLKALDREAWAMVERTRQKPETYDAIHRMAMARGREEPPARALAGCAAWVKDNAAKILDHADSLG